MNYRKVPTAIIFSILAMGIQSCSITKQNAFPAMYEKPQVSILVLPPINETTSADAQEFYQTTISEPLSLTGYYVYPMEVVVDILKNEGLYEMVDWRRVDPTRFKEYFGADAVLQVTILNWDKVYYVIGGHVMVSIDMKLISTETGETLWRYNGTMKIDTSVDSGAPGLAGLLINAVSTAVATGLTDYVPIAKKANISALSTIPYGKYHPKHLNDGNEKSIKKNTMRQMDKRESGSE